MFYEEVIGGEYDKAYLDASLPAAVLYEKLGFSTIKHECYPVENGVMIVYELWKKNSAKVLQILIMTEQKMIAFWNDYADIGRLK